MERRSRKRSSSAGSEKMERVGDRKNGEVLFDRPKPTTGCSANRRRRRRSTAFKLLFLSPLERL
jgi:hypothetical protein